MSVAAIHRLAVAAYLALLALTVAWLLWLAPPPEALTTIALVSLVGPLLIPLWGVLRGHRYTVAWSTMIVLIYFIHGVTHAAGGEARALGLIEIALALSYFLAAILYVRLAASPRGAASPGGGASAARRGR